MAELHVFEIRGKKLEIKTVKGSNIQTSETAQNAPGTGNIEIENPVLSADQGSCSAAIKGKNIAQIYAEVMLQLEDVLIGPVTSDFLHAPKEREVGKVLHPRWPHDPMVTFEVKPALRLLYSGDDFTLACLQPVHYGASAEKQTWLLEGKYQRGGGEPFRVELTFDGQGKLMKKTGFNKTTVGLESPFDLTIDDGDTFEPYLNMITVEGKQLKGLVSPIMFGSGKTPNWVKVEAPAGLYQVGVKVQDFDGNLTRKYSPLQK